MRAIITLPSEHAKLLDHNGVKIKLDNGNVAVSSSDTHGFVLLAVGDLVRLVSADELRYALNGAEGTHNVKG